MEPTEHILQFFAYTHLPPHLAAVSKPFCELAHAIVLGDNVPEATGLVEYSIEVTHLGAAIIAGFVVAIWLF